MVVRNKIKTWLKESDDVLFALKNIPQARKLRKSISDDEVFAPFYVALYLMNEFNFQPVDKMGDRHVVLMGSRSKHHLDEIWLRDATSEEITRNTELREILSNLTRFVSRKELLDELDKMYADKYKAEKADWEERTSDN